MANYQDSNLNQVVFNKVTKEQYDSQVSSGSIKENEFYLVSGDVEIPAIGVDTNGKVLSNNGSKLNWVESTSGSSDYTDLTNKPQINSIELSGNKSLDDLGIASKNAVYTKTEADEKYATIEQGNKADTAVQPTTLNNYALKTSIPTKVSQLTNDSGYLIAIPSEYITETELNGKGYQTTANMESSVSTSTTKYPSSKAVSDKLNTKQNTITGGATTITSSNLTVGRALISDSNGKVAVSSATSTELGYLDGVTSGIQSQLNDRAKLSGNNTYKGTNTFQGSDKIIVNNAFSSSATIYAKANDTNGKGQAALHGYYTSSRDLYNRLYVRNTTANKDAYIDVVLNDNGTVRYQFGGGSSYNLETSSNSQQAIPHTKFVHDVVNEGLATKQNTITGGASTITSSNLTANRALISNGSGKVTVSAVTSTELGYLDGVTSGIQSQLNNKVGLSGNQTINGTKTFTGNILRKSSASSVTDTSREAVEYDSIGFGGKTGSNPSYFEQVWNTDGSRNFQLTIRNNTDKGWEFPLKVSTPKYSTTSSGSKVYTLNPSSDSNDSQIATTVWVNNKLSTLGVGKHIVVSTLPAKPDTSAFYYIPEE